MKTFGTQNKDDYASTLLGVAMYSWDMSRYWISEKQRWLSVHVTDTTILNHVLAEIDDLIPFFSLS